MVEFGDWRACRLEAVLAAGGRGRPVGPVVAMGRVYFLPFVLYWVILCPHGVLPALLLSFLGQKRFGHSMWFNGPNYATMRQAEEDAKETPTNDGFSAILDLRTWGPLRLTSSLMVSWYLCVRCVPQRNRSLLMEIVNLCLWCGCRRVWVWVQRRGPETDLPSATSSCNSPRQRSRPSSRPRKA